MQTFVFSIILFLLGLFFGSFYTMVGHRVPKKDSILHARPHCPSCKSRLRPAELIPIFSFLKGRGKCKGCGTPIPPLYPIMEGLTGISFLLVFLQYAWTWETVCGLLFVSLLIIITVSDLEYQLIPNKVLLPFMLLFLILRFIHPYGETSYEGHLIGMAAGFLFFLVLAVISRGGVGGGDVKLFAVIGLFLPPALLVLTIFFSSAMGAFFGLFQWIRGRASRTTMIPFGPFIALGAVTAYVYGRALLIWYFTLNG
ncbi:prepilin peptidase [Brevibacillus migulae]|uniref:prepilin peptidase n=1 Tax=Brevibacillus migulae TaxID=1644114 RepID=UPI001F2CF36C|nr:A24 family peptidase [Brevibacillus migulae]